MRQTLAGPFDSSQLEQINRRLDAGDSVTVWAKVPGSYLAEHGPIEMVDLGNQQVEFTLISDDPRTHGQSEVAGLEDLVEIEIESSA